MLDSTKFDAVTRLFAERRTSRREAIAQAIGGLAAGAGVMAVTGTSARAQEATPEASPAESFKKSQYLFVQSFNSGTITQSDAGDGSYTLSLQHGLGQTIYFSDRPERTVGAAPTEAFLDGLPFSESNPPNAALVVASPDGTTDIAVLELMNPVYDADGPGVTYAVRPLAEWEQSLEMAFAETPKDLADLLPEFGNAHLFIDDCPDLNIECWWYRNGECSPASCVKDRDYHKVGDLGVQGFCWNWLRCVPCEPYGHSEPYAGAAGIHWDEVCNQTFPDQCGNLCRAVH